MATTAAYVINRIKILTADEDASLRRWSDAELLMWLSDGQRVMSTLKPDVCQKIEAVQLALGTRQSLPSDGISLISIIRNMGRDGETPGRAIRLVKREIMDSQNPDWHGEAKRFEIRQYIYDPMDQNTFYVYPPSNGQGYVDAHFNYVPADVDETTDNLSILDNYIPALIDYVLYRAYSKDSDFAGGVNQAKAYLETFMLMMGAGKQAELETNPNVKLAPFELAPKQRAQ